MKTLFTFIFLLLSSFFAFSNNYVPGYIITNNGDTIQGFINFKTDNINLHLCNFKESESSPEQFYRPFEIMGYRLTDDGKYYVSHKIDLDGKPIPAFLEYLVQGKMNLYYCKDNSKEYYFFEKEDGKLYPISKNPDKLVEKNKMQPDNKYKGVLAYIMQDSPSTVSKASKSSFNRSSLVELTKNYHRETCSPGEECIVFENDYKRNFTQFKFTIYGGIQNNKLLYNDSFCKYNFDHSTSPFVGMQLNVYYPRLSKSFSFFTDISYSTLNTRGTGSRYNKSCIWKIESSLIDATLGISYAFRPNKKLRPILEGGFVNCIMFNYSWNLDIEDRTNDEPYPLEKIRFGYRFGLGFDYNVYKKSNIFFRVSFENTGSDNDKIRSINSKLGYTF